MKKYIAFAVVLSMLLIPMVSAGYYWSSNVGQLNLQEKDSNWNVVENGSNGVITFSKVTTFPFMRPVSENIRVSVNHLIPKTNYQLIYYGNEEFNDVWNYATCIGKEFKTGTSGQYRTMSAKFNYLDMMSDEIAQKFWVVLASDVDCEQGIMTAWNPREYLFEENTI